MGYAEKEENYSFIQTSNQVELIIRSQGDISNFKQTDYIKEERTPSVPEDQDPFLVW